jgi:hypothetical protein
MIVETERQLGSFRDPSGFVFTRDGELLRQVNAVYREDFEAFIESGLYEELSSSGLLIPHESVGLNYRVTDDAIDILRPTKLRTISYPYEWCFSQLKDAALCTLAIQQKALEKGLSLKDASAYNVQFLKGKPVFIDTLSFERYREGSPWIAYRQFCGHFLAPLALMAFRDVRLAALQRTYLDGIPLDLASHLLPAKTRFMPGLAMHLHLHAKAQSNSGSNAASARAATISKTNLLALIDSLSTCINSLEWRPAGTVWGDYYDNTNYSEGAFAEKAQIVGQFLDRIVPKPSVCWDLGANTGEFSRIAADRGIDTVAFDVDPAAVEKAYRAVRAKSEERVLPLLQDLTNPSPDQGWAGSERDSLLNRGPAEVVLALALVHHLAIGNNVPLDRVAEFFASAGQWLIVEFVAKADSQVQRMLSSRVDVFTDYNREGFERACAPVFETVERHDIQGMDRTLYLMKRSR